MTGWSIRLDMAGKRRCAFSFLRIKENVHFCLQRVSPILSVRFFLPKKRTKKSHRWRVKRAMVKGSFLSDQPAPLPDEAHPKSVSRIIIPE
jgi:hypothetical protein